jgi:hypothetical protein
MGICRAPCGYRGLSGRLLVDETQGNVVQGNQITLYDISSRTPRSAAVAPRDTLSHCVSGIGIELVRSHGMNRDSSIIGDTRCKEESRCIHLTARS